MTEEYRKDEYKKVKIPFGFNREQLRVVLALFHSFFVAMTGHGKTLGMKSLLLRFHELYPDWKILILDSKDKRDYADLNADIPICFVETTDPLDLKNLLEPILGANMIFFFDKIIEECVHDTLGEIHRAIHQKVVDADTKRLKMSGRDLGKLRVIDYTMGKLVALVEKPNIIKELKLHDGFNVMPISLPEVKNPNLKRAFQQLIVRSALVLLLSDPSLERTLLVVDECHKWIGQRYQSICKQPLSEFVSEGRSQDKIVWLSDQALTKVDKEPLKSVKIWVVGQQMESNEVDDAKNTVNDMTDLSVTDTDIKTLKTGSFILVDGLHGKVERAYLQPYNVPDEVAVKIAEGANPESAEPFIMAWEKKARQEQVNDGDEDMVYKQKFEDLQKEFEEFRERTEKEVEALRKSLCDSEKRESELEDELEKLQTFKQAIREFFAPLMVQSDASHSEGVEVNLGASLTVINLKDNAPQEVNLTTDKPTGKLMYCAVQLYNRTLKKDADSAPAFTSAELQKEAVEHGWQLTNYLIGKALGYVTQKGWLIKESAGFRLPTKLKINVVKGS